MKSKVLSLLAGTAMLVTMTLGISGCMQQGGTSGEALYQRVPAKEHKAEFPDGHTGGGKCYYDEKADVYFCSY